jgi:DNA-binding GntR family transcriptional regulator
MNLKERIVPSLRDAIIRGAYRPGERLKEITLCERYKVSRTPIREALNQLESEGFIKFAPGVGATVTSLSLEDVSEIFEMLIILESGAARIAASRINDHEIIKLEEFQFAMERAINGNRVETTIVLNNEFHRLITVCSGNPHIVDFQANFWRLAERIIRMVPLVPGQLRATLEQHRDIIEALKGRDPLAVGLRVEEHFEATRKRLLEYLRPFI